MQIMTLLYVNDGLPLNGYEGSSNLVLQLELEFRQRAFKTNRALGEIRRQQRQLAYYVARRPSTPEKGVW